MASNAVAADELRLLLERIERLEEEKKGIADDIKDVYGEAKSRGFCPKTLRTMYKLRKEKPDDRREREAMEDLYKAALGMLDGTPLGTWALEKVSKGRKKGADTPEAPVEPAAPTLTVEDAKRLGGEAAREGKPVTANPFPPRDVRRAAWDEAWCHELGSDGMDIPDALRPAAKKPKEDKGASAPAIDPDRCDKTDDMFGKGAPQGDQEPGLGDADPLMDQARALVLESQKASTSHIQRALKIGYNRAAQIIEQLEADGVVSAADERGHRAVLLDAEGNAK